MHRFMVEYLCISAILVCFFVMQKEGFNIKKKIAIDLDGVIFDSENLYRVYGEVYDTDIKVQDSVIDNSKRLYQERYNWTEKDFNDFYQKYSASVMVNSNFMAGVETVLSLLAKKFELVIVTARTDEEMVYTKARLDTLGIKNLKIFNNEHFKIDRFQKESVTYVIDDSEVVCMDAAKNGFIAFYLKNNAAEKIIGLENIINVNNWGEIYKYLILNNKD